VAAAKFARAWGARSSHAAATGVLVRTAVYATIWAHVLAFSPRAIAQAEHPQDIPIQQHRDDLLAGRPVQFDPINGNRVILAEWIQGAVSKSIPINIRNAVIRGNLNLQQLRVSTEFKLLSCDVEGEADFSATTFQNDVVLNDTFFHLTVRFARTEFDSNLGARHAKFEHSATFAAMQVRGVADFSEDLFQGDANFNYSTIAVNVDFRGSVFERNASFGNANLGRAALFGKHGSGPQPAPARFEGMADFTNTEMQDASFGGVLFSSGVDFGRAQIKGSAHFPKALFKGWISFRDARFQGLADFTGAHMGGAKGAVVFAGINIDGDAYFVQTVFDTQVLFTNVQIKGDAVFRGATFRAAAIFYGAQISGRALFGQGSPLSPQGQPPTVIPAAVFNDDVDFRSARIGGDADFLQSVFKKPINFEAAQVGGTCQFGMTKFLGQSLFGGLIAGEATFDQAEFELPTNFDGVHIGGNLKFVGTRFDGAAHLIQVSVGGQSDFTGSRFGGPTRFDAADFKGSSVFRNVVFSANSRPYFGGVRFHQWVNFRDTTFTAGASFIDTEFDTEVTFENVQFQGRTTFEYCRFGGTARFGSPEEVQQPQEGSGFADVSFDGAKFSGIGDFQEATFAGRTSFRDASIRVLKLSPNGLVRSRDQIEGAIDLRGCTYDQIQADWRKVFGKLQPYARQPYVQLEKTLRADGDDTEANSVYVERKGKERQQRGWGLKRGMDWLWWQSSDYGVSPSRLLFLSGAFVLIGAFIFRQPNAVLVGEEMRTITFWNALWLSFRLFLPIKFEVAPPWKPTPWHRSVHLCSGVLNICGWILVPLFVVVLSGLLQYVPK
jgi:uncharacterized protein YjbI with pentapeptide repeats